MRGGAARVNVAVDSTATAADTPRVDDAWTAIRVELPEALADAAASLLLDEGAGGVLTDVREAGTEPPPPGRARLEAHVPAASADDVAATLGAWLRDVAPDARAVVTTAPVPPVDWQAVFREHHHPMPVGTRLLVAPPWDVPEAPGREILVIEPGMAFGTGQHATTRTCLEEIDELADGTVRSALDVGTGSGVLAAALRRLGVPRVVATDLDAAVLPLARETLDANGAADVVLVPGTAAAVDERFDVVVANLLADALVADADALMAAVAPGGRLVVSGLLADQVPRVLASYPGWRVTRTRGDDPWRTLRLERAA